MKRFHQNLAVLAALIQAQRREAPYRLLCGDALATLRRLPPESVQACVTSPPYWGLRDYGIPGQLGLEESPDEYVQKLVEVFREVRRILKDSGTLWLNLGDSYAGSWGAQSRPCDTSLSARQIEAHPKRTGTGSLKRTPGLKGKDLIGVPWAVAFALRADGWYLRSDIIWHKPNCMPSSVRDRPTTSHEYLFLLSKSERYFYDAEAVREPQADKSQKRMAAGYRDSNVDRTDRRGYRGPLGGKNGMTFNPDGRNRRSVWTVSTSTYRGAHFATYPPGLVTPCVLAGSAEGDTILDPFNGAGTTGLVALEHGRKYIGIDLNAEYLSLTRNRFREGVR